MSLLGIMAWLSDCRLLVVVQLMDPVTSGSDLQSTSRPPSEAVFRFGAPVVRFSVVDSDSEQAVAGVLPSASSRRVGLAAAGLSDAEGHALDPFVTRKFVGLAVLLLLLFSVCRRLPAMWFFRLM